MLAQWNPAIFTPQDLNTRSIRVYFHLNGGTGVPESPDSVPYYYEKLGYATEPVVLHTHTNLELHII